MTEGVKLMKWNSEWTMNSTQLKKRNEAKRFSEAKSETEFNESIHFIPLREDGMKLDD